MYFTHVFDKIPDITDVQMSNTLLFKGLIDYQNCCKSYIQAWNLTLVFSQKVHTIIFQKGGGSRTLKN